MKIGTYDVKASKTGLFRLDGGAMFGVVPKVFWNKLHPADEKNRILMSTSLVLIRGGGKNIMVDTGNCESASDKMKSIYGMDNSEYSMGIFLSRFGLSRNDITDVILTHLHFDHAGGAVKEDGTGNLAPAFPNAHYHVQRKQMDWAGNPSGRDRASYVKEQIMPLEESGQLKLIEGPGELYPGIELIVCDGHTPGMQLPLISGDDTKFLYAGDLIPLHSQIALPWIMAYDLQPLVTLEEKEKILGQAVDENWVIFFEHDPDKSCCRIERDKKGFKIKDDVDLGS